MNDTQFDKLVARLDKILKLLAIQAVREKKAEQDKIALLDSIGFSPSDIDEMLGKRAGRASKVLYELRSKKKPKPDTRGSKSDETSSEQVISNPP